MRGICYVYTIIPLNNQMKLKQKFALGLCAFYLISVIGVALRLHFCGGTLSAVHFNQTPKCKACITAEKTAKSDNCCKNTAVDAKIKDSHESGSKVNVPKKYSIELFLAPFLSDVFRIILPKFSSRINDDAPPLSARVSLYAYNCVFRN